MPKYFLYMTFHACRPILQSIIPEGRWNLTIFSLVGSGLARATMDLDCHLIGKWTEQLGRFLVTHGKNAQRAVDKSSEMCQEEYLINPR